MKKLLIKCDWNWYLVWSGAVVANLWQVGRQRRIAEVDGQVRAVAEVEDDEAAVVVINTEEAVGGGVEIHFESCKN